MGTVCYDIVYAGALKYSRTSQHIIEKEVPVLGSSIESFRNLLNRLSTVIRLTFIDVHVLKMSMHFLQFSQYIQASLHVFWVLVHNIQNGFQELILNEASLVF